MSQFADLSYAELRSARDDINVRIKELERAAIVQLEQQAQQFGFQLVKPGQKIKIARAAIKYRDDAGNTWSGRGKHPGWLTEKLDAGRTLEEFLI
jgi:DNA-binding protein H-NS